MAIEIVDLPIKIGGSFHSYVNVYQRVIGKLMIHQRDLGYVQTMTDPWQTHIQWSWSNDFQKQMVHTNNEQRSVWFREPLRHPWKLTMFEPVFCTSECLASLRVQSLQLARPIDHKLLTKMEPQEKVRRVLGRVTFSRHSSKRRPNTKLHKSLGRVTPSRLW